MKVLTEQAKLALSEGEEARPRGHSLLRHSSDGLAGAGGPKARRVTRGYVAAPRTIADRDLSWPRSDAVMLRSSERQMTISWKALAFALTLSLAGCGEGDPKGATNPAGTAGAGGTLTETSTTGGLGGSDTTGGTSGTGGALGDAGEMYDASMDDGTSAGDGSLSDQASGRDAGPSL